MAQPQLDRRVPRAPSLRWAGSIWVLGLGLCAGGCRMGQQQGSDRPLEVSPPLELVQRRVSCMGTLLLVEVEAPTRRAALLASEAAVLALETVEARLSTWRPDSELSRLNRAELGAPFELSAELAADLAAARAGWEATRGAFDPLVGALVEAWGLRTAGRLPSASELEAALVPEGFAALELDGRRARRLHPAARIEEGGFGKGIGLDLALAGLAEAGARRARLDLGGQVAVLASRESYFAQVRHPWEREQRVLELELREGSLATTGNGERGLLVDGIAIGHVLDPRSGEPVPDFGSLTVWATDATRADIFSTGLYVLGPERALALAAAREDLGVLVLERAAGGTAPGLRARADPTFAALVSRTSPGLSLEVFAPPLGGGAGLPSVPPSSATTRGMLLIR